MIMEFIDVYNCLVLGIESDEFPEDKLDCANSDI